MIRLYSNSSLYDNFCHIFILINIVEIITLGLGFMLVFSYKLYELFLILKTQLLTIQLYETHDTL